MRLFVAVAVVIGGCVGGCNKPAAGPGPVATTAKPAAAGPAVLTPSKLPVQGAGVHKVADQSPARDQIRYVIAVPADLPADKKVPLVVTLHYSGRENAAFYGADMVTGVTGPAVEPLGAIVVGPDCLGRDDDWASPDNVAFVTWLTASVIQSYPIDPKKVLLTGYSAGGIGTWAIGAAPGTPFTAAMPVAGDPKGNQRAWTLPVYAIHARADDTIRAGPTQAAIAELAGRGVNAKLDLLGGGVTHFDTGAYGPAMEKAVGWLKTVWK